MIYVPETWYFDLFQSYGWLGDNYDIRVGRSRQVEGPYLDMQGRSLVEASMGVRIAGSYRFRAEAPNSGDAPKDWHFNGFRGPGHGVPFYDPQRNAYFFVYHIRDGAEIYRKYDPHMQRDSYRMHYLMIRPMFFTDGWPVLGPEPYAGEPVVSFPAAGRMAGMDGEEPSAVSLAAGMPAAEFPDAAEWEIIRFIENGNRIVVSTQMKAQEAAELIRGGVFHRSWDFENSRPVVTVSGFDRDGYAYWGKAC